MEVFWIVTNTNPSTMYVFFHRFFDVYMQVCEGVWMCVDAFRCL